MRRLIPLLLLSLVSGVALGATALEANCLPMVVQPADGAGQWVLCQGRIEATVPDQEQVSLVFAAADNVSRTIIGNASGNLFVFEIAWIDLRLKAAGVSKPADALEYTIVFQNQTGTTTIGSLRFPDVTDAQQVEPWWRVNWKLLAGGAAAFLIVLTAALFIAHVVKSNREWEQMSRYPRRAAQFAPAQPRMTYVRVVVEDPTTGTDFTATSRVQCGTLAIAPYRPGEHGMILSIIELASLKEASFKVMNPELEIRQTHLPRPIGAVSGPPEVRIVVAERTYPLAVSVVHQEKGLPLASLEVTVSPADVAPPRDPVQRVTDAAGRAQFMVPKGKWVVALRPTGAIAAPTATVQVPLTTKQKTLSAQIAPPSALPRPETGASISAPTALDALRVAMAEEVHRTFAEAWQVPELHLRLQDRADRMYTSAGTSIQVEIKELFADMLGEKQIQAHLIGRELKNGGGAFRWRCSPQHLVTMLTGSPEDLRARVAELRRERDAVDQQITARTRQLMVRPLIRMLELVDDQLQAAERKHELASTSPMRTPEPALVLTADIVLQAIQMFLQDAALQAEWAKA